MSFTPSEANESPESAYTGGKASTRIATTTIITIAETNPQTVHTKGFLAFFFLQASAN
jgi:hypothetical protein